MIAGAGRLAALLLADGRLPVGSYAYSAGLEPAVAAGLRREEIPALLRARVRTVCVTEAAAAVLAARTAAAPGPGGAIDYGPVQRALAARTPAAPLRAAGAALGRGVHRLARRLAPGHPAITALETAVLPGPPVLRPLRPVVTGALAAVLGVEAAELARTVIYDDLQAVASAALKLLPGDPLDSAAWLVEAAPGVEAAVAEAVAVSDPAGLPARSAPLVEQWALAHERTERRLFLA
ncbi:urease accessory protein UreF [Streptomyces iconiensis]|uniref:Urease accessory UreF family protein n=1 Tax=Streptomyces iconiensis TaxID=1384038 RepID=A0ABT6ZS91_9ACTN|nr:urease accessory UreF family protein [Streptomyces iconiensis]MDJ1131932.1 urease accessory UreF family protein [Streptomyces iconiensis]